MAEALISRTEARRLGLKRYYTGVECRKGHIAERSLSNGVCILCHAERMRTKGAETRRKAVRLWRERNPDYYREQVYTRPAERERLALKHKETPASQHREQAHRWRKANPEKADAISRNCSGRRRARKAGGVSTTALAAWTASQKKVCYWCGCNCRKGFHIDHYVPLSKGGKHDISNLVIACGPCNLRKNAKDPLDFAREVGRLL